ncbi:MAG: signal peptidase I [Candidatus Bathyarchaeota archaeon]|nr:signal peptidase I [Candidatus Bathyarchaeota archaeon]MDW8040464.1 signal peptidase I [Nitrososphaerota archaeon]
MKPELTIPALILTVYLLTNLIVPYAFRGELIFIVDTLLWATVIPLTLLTAKNSQTNLLKTDKTLIQLATIIAIFQVSLSVFMAFFMGFGRNSLVWTPRAIAIYFPFLLAPFLATEISRAYLAQTASKHKPTTAILLTGLFYALLKATVPQYQGLTSPLAIAEFLIRTFIPTLATSLLATYFAYLGALPANLAYMAVPTFFTWFSPILPNLPWQTSSILTVIGATVGFLLLDAAVKPLPTAKHRRQTRLHLTRKGEKQATHWTVIALIAVIAVWSTTGLLGFTPTIIASGSMTPTLNVGDIAIVLSTPAKAIRVGDIIQYYRASGEPPIIHRVIDKYESGGTTWFITQGDANNAPDDPINENQVKGKVIFTIPKLGWVSITLKEAATAAYTFIAQTLPTALTQHAPAALINGLPITALLTLTAYTSLLLAYHKTTKKEGKNA